MTVAAGVMGAGVAIALWTLADRLAPGPNGRITSRLAPAARRSALVAVALLSAAGTASLAFALPWRPGTIALVAMAAAAPGLAYIDLVTERLPFALTGALAALAATAFITDAVATGHADAMARAGLTAAAVAFLGTAAGLIPGPGGASAVGGGDIALATVVAATLGWLGWVTVWIGFFVALLMWAVVAELIRSRHAERKEFLQFGPFIFFGWYLATALAALGAF